MFHAKNYFYWRNGQPWYGVRVRATAGASLLLALLAVGAFAWWAYARDGWAALGLWVLGIGSVGRLRACYQHWLQVAQLHHARLKAGQAALQQANAQLQQECERKVNHYLQEVTEARLKLWQVHDVWARKGDQIARQLLQAEVGTQGEFYIVLQQVREVYPEFAQRADNALAQRKISKLVWQIAYCLRLGMAPREVAVILPTTNRSVSSQACRLRNLGLLPR